MVPRQKRESLRNTSILKTYVLCSKEKRPRPVKLEDEDEEDLGYLTDDDRRGRPKKRGSSLASLPRGDKTDVGNRKATLEADKWTTDVQPYALTCAGCKKAVKLRKGVMYALKPWESHKKTCKNVKGEVSI